MIEKTIGVVDIGSNTVHLLVARTDGHTITTLVDISAGLRLGADMDESGALSAAKIVELTDTLLAFQAEASQLGVKDLQLLATYAIRAASNRDIACKVITDATGLNVRVLTPEEEATLAFRGATADTPGIGAQVMVDIGGGSAQIAVGERGEIWDTVSLPLGASRMADHFLHSDPPTQLEEAMLASYMATVIPSALPLLDTNVIGVIGVGGTLRRAPALFDLQTGQNLPHDATKRALTILRGKSSFEIADAYLMKQSRARLLMPAFILLGEVLKGYDFPPLRVAAYGIREGAILSQWRQCIPD